MPSELVGPLPLIFGGILTAGVVVGIERHAVTEIVDWAIGLLATHAFIDLIAVAAVVLGRCAEAPDGMLDESREIRRERGVIVTRINLSGNALDNRAAPVCGIAPGPIGVLSAKIAENTGAV